MCPRMIAGPVAPGVGLWKSQPACIGWLTGGTWTVSSALSPSCTSVDRAPILGMSTETGSDLAIPATSAVSPFGDETCCCSVAGGGFVVWPPAPQPPSSAASPAAARSTSPRPPHALPTLGIELALARGGRGVAAATTGRGGASRDLGHLLRRRILHLRWKNDKLGAGEGVEVPVTVMASQVHLVRPGPHRFDRTEIPDVVLAGLVPPVEVVLDGGHRRRAQIAPLIASDKDLHFGAGPSPMSRERDSRRAERITGRRRRG